MHDISDQLANYFDATVERLTVEDLQAASEVDMQARPVIEMRRPRLRPAWALLVAFVTTISVVGGSLGIGLMLRRDPTPVGASGDPSVGRQFAEAADTGGEGWVFVVGAVLLILLVGGLMAARGRTKKLGTNGGETMTTTLERPTPTDRGVEKLMKTNRTLTFMAIVLAVLAVGFGSWAVYQATTGDETPAVEEVATSVAPTMSAELAAVPDNWVAALERRDGSIVDLYAVGGFHSFNDKRYYGDEIENHLTASPELNHEWVTEPILLFSDEADGRFTIARTMRNSTPTFSATSALVFEIVTGPDGELLIANDIWTQDP